MTPIVKRTKKDSAVSPVVGVMLMLVVTIIIAAVVAVFASGIVTNAETAPTAVLKATVDSTWNDGYISHEKGYGALFLTNLSGDDLNLEKVEVKVSKDSTYETTYSAPVNSSVAGKYLKSGSTLNLISGKYGWNSSKSLSDELGTEISKGDVLNVTVVYDKTYILYDKEVVAA